MELNEYVATLRKHVVAIVALGLLGALGAFGYAASQPAVYTAKVSLYVVVPGGETVGERVQGATYAEGRIASYAELARQPFVLEPVVRELGLSSSVRTVARNVSTTTTLNTSFLDIAYTHQNPERAADVANAIGAELSRAVTDLEGEGPQTAAIELTVVAAAEPPTRPSAPNTRLLVVAGFVIGLSLGVAFALARGLLDTRIRSVDDLRRVTDAAVLGVVRRTRRHPGEPPAVFDIDPSGEQAEAYRRLRTNVQFLDTTVDRRSLLVTSSVDGEGKTATALNLAVALAERSKRVLLVDANVRHTEIAALTGADGAAGLMAVLVGRAHEDDVVRPWRDNLDVLVSGVLPSNPSDLLESSAMAALMDRLVAKYDAVVIEAPALLSSVDAVVLSRLVDGVLVVVGSSAVRRAELTGALQALEGVGAPLLGLVLNKSAGKGAKAAYAYTAVTRGGRHRRRAAARPRPDSDDPVHRAVPTDEVGWYPHHDEIPGPRAASDVNYRRRPAVVPMDHAPTQEIAVAPAPKAPSSFAEGDVADEETAEGFLPLRGSRDGAS